MSGLFTCYYDCGVVWSCMSYYAADGSYDVGFDAVVISVAFVWLYGSFG